MKTKLYSKDINVDSTHISLKSDLDYNIIPFIEKQRQIITDEIRINPDFIKYKPIPLIHKEKILEHMTYAGKISDTGPMSSVAGSVSEVCLEEFIKRGSKFSIIENGGDIALKTERKVILGIYAGESVFSYEIGLKIKPKPKGYGICTSSCAGPSKSFGLTDATIVFSNQSSVADSLATCIGNYGNGDSDEEIINNSLEKAEEYSEYFEGVLVIKGDTLGKTGHIPKLVKTRNKH
ncbi:UPF0280 family protein [Methanosphaera sp. WGK6]|uniref:UPF0280 family protein n=1 Tax=Methanosphaera sp. WGK6 TaxID=1561964 RepID=UPI00084C4826|nr:UPF0280 family protein [Methanosphaera sp. WGK6]OED30618.1 hypothetical protein NL43_01360 [Methanosphaera sp. WGK6]